MRDGSIPGLQYEVLTAGGATYRVGMAGDGPPVLLLHGFPQTHYCWRHVVPALVERHRVLATDLRGYGATAAPAGGQAGEGYTKREMAADLVELLHKLDLGRVSVVGHDRGARVAYRLALDYAALVERLAVLNVVPTVDQFERLSAGSSLGYWPWFLLAQPAPFPEQLIAASRESFLRYVFRSWPDRPDAIDDDAFAVYLDALDEATIASMCADYRASFWLDREHELADRRATRHIRCPVLVVTGAAETQLADAGDVWRRWADDVQATTVPSGHFVPEEAPRELAHILLEFLEQRDP